MVNVKMAKISAKFVLKNAYTSLKDLSTALNNHDRH